MQHAKSIAYSNRRDINPILFTPNAMEWFLWYQQYKIQFYARPHFTSTSFFLGGIGICFVVIVLKWKPIEITFSFECLMDFRFSYFA